MKVSIITPTYNSQDYIAETLDSVLQQSYQDWELIIVDDCSVDDTLSVVSRYVANDTRIRLIKLPENSGAAVSRNLAIKESRGRFIAFLDSDDLWAPEKLERQISFMVTNGFQFTFTAYQKFDESGSVIGTVPAPALQSYQDLLKMSSIGCLTAIYDTEYFGKVQMPLIRKRQDLGLWLALLKKVDYAHGLNTPLAKYRVRSDSISANKLNAAGYTWHLYRDVERLSIFKSVYYFSHYAFRGLLRTKFPSVAARFRLLE